MEPVPSGIYELGGNGHDHGGHADGNAATPRHHDAADNQTVTAGQTATFSVVASGSAPLSYQWQRNWDGLLNYLGRNGGELLPTAPTTTSDSGSTFQVVVSNCGGPGDQ